VTRCVVHGKLNRDDLTQQLPLCADHRLPWMRLIEPFQFETPKPDRARLLIAGVLWLNVIILWAILKNATNGRGGISEAALLCMAPSIAALVTLLRHKGLDGANLARVVAWGYVVAGTIFGTVAMVFSAGHRASDTFALWAFVLTLLSVQILIPAAIRWGRTEVTLRDAFARYMLVFAVLGPILVVGFLFS
jgi:hypothetical protein